MPSNTFNSKNISIIVAVVLVLILLLIFVGPKLCLTHVRADNGEKYNVQRIFDDRDDAANLLAQINTRVLDLLKYLKDKYGVSKYDGSNNGRDPYLTGIVARLVCNYNPEVINETNPIVSSDTSYTIDKGRQLFVCMREKTPPYKLHNIDDLMFVVLHEISHMGNLTFGHDTQFWSVFKFVLHEANISNLYKPTNYKLHPRMYCGLKVDYNPYYDPSIPDIWK
jgi:hypothetical protein